VREEYDEKIRQLIKDKHITILCDETTNRKGEAVFLTMYKILPSEDNIEPILVVASVDVLPVCNADQCCKAVMEVCSELNMFFF